MGEYECRRNNDKQDTLLVKVRLLYSTEEREREIERKYVCDYLISDNQAYMLAIGLFPIVISSNSNARTEREEKKKKIQSTKRERVGLSSNQ